MSAERYADIFPLPQRWPRYPGGVPLDAYPVSRMVNTPSGNGHELIRPIASPVFFPRLLSLLVTFQFIQTALEPFHLFLLFQDKSHDHGLKRPWSRDHGPA